MLAVQSGSWRSVQHLLPTSRGWDRTTSGVGTGQACVYLEGSGGKIVLEGDLCCPPSFSQGLWGLSSKLVIFSWLEPQFRHYRMPIPGLYSFPFPKRCILSYSGWSQTPYTVVVCVHHVWIWVFSLNSSPPPLLLHFLNLSWIFGCSCCILRVYW